MASGLITRVFRDPDTVAREAAAEIASVIAHKTAGGEGFSLALSGGRTPRPLYQCLANEYRDRVPWARVSIYWGDERFVPHDDPASNYRLAAEALLDHVPIPSGQVHPIPALAATADEAARAYERVLRDHFGARGPRFDLTLLGIGSDGHTASLFPGAPALDESERWVAAAAAPVEPKVRLTLTLAALNRSRSVFFVVTGADKAPAMRRIARESPDYHLCPAVGIHPAGGPAVWWLDGAAAASL